MINFHNDGPLDEEEIQHLLNAHHKYGRHSWQTTIDCGDGISPRTYQLVRELLQDQGKMMDRLVLTIERLYQSTQFVPSREE